MNMNDFQALRKIQIEIMDEIHRVCCENNIKYYLIAGSAIGAVRHMGIIPWDCDIDIALMRKDYNKFKEVCMTELSDEFFYLDYTLEKEFDHPHALVCKKNTYLEMQYDNLNKKHASKHNRAVYVDVFPLDDVPAELNLQKQQAQTIHKINMLKYRKNACHYDNNFVKTIIKKLIGLSIFWTSIDKLNEQLEKEITKYTNDDAEYCCSMTSHYSYQKQCMPKSYYGTPVLAEFEGREYYIPEKTHEYLTHLYGDYMKLPSKEEQQVCLDTYSKLEIL